MLELVHRVLWGPWLMALFLAAGAVYTVRSRCFQVRGLMTWWRATVGSLFREGAPEEASGPGAGARDADRRTLQGAQIKTACTALAATVGTGNIVGVATAITAGGPGALFWMWASAALGMMTAYGEVYLGIKSRLREQDGRVLCGPFVYLERLAKRPLLAGLYALFALLCSLGMGSMVQANSLADTVAYAFRLPKLLTAAGLGLLTAAVIRGGREKIGQAAARLVPLSAGLYIFFALAVICFCRETLPVVLQDIFREAFCLRAAAGGAAGTGISQAMRYGLARGVFSNEAGLGSMAILHGDSPGEDPGLQGMWAMFEVFFDTILVCTLTGLALLCGIQKAGGDLGLQGAALTSWCFALYLGDLGGYVLSLSLVLFAFATIIAWYYLGSQALAYLEEKRGRWKVRRRTAGRRTDRGMAGDPGRGADDRKGREEPGETGLSRVYRWAYLVSVVTGCLAGMGKVWLLSDIFNGLMALPNLAALFLLAGQVRFPAAQGLAGQVPTSATEGRRG